VLFCVLLSSASCQAALCLNQAIHVQASGAPLPMGGKLSFFRLAAPNSWNNLPASLKRAPTLFGVWTLLILFLKKPQLCEMSTSSGWSLLCAIKESCPSVSRHGQSPFIPAELLMAGDTRTNCPLCRTGTDLLLRANSSSAPRLSQRGPGLLVSPCLNRKAES